MSTRLYRGLICGLWGCLIFAILTVALDAAVSATPWTTRDSHGATMEFNDRFSREHYSLALANLRPWHLLHPKYIYDWAEWAMILVGMRLLATKGDPANRKVLWFYWAQSGLFVPGVLSLLFLQWPEILMHLFSSRLTREDFVDVPFTWEVAQPAWVLTSAAIGAILYSQSIRPPVSGAVVGSGAVGIRS